MIVKPPWLLLSSQKMKPIESRLQGRFASLLPLLLLLRWVEAELAALLGFLLLLWVFLQALVRALAQGLAQHSLGLQPQLSDPDR